jgi:hypothetical protein
MRELVGYLSPATPSLVHLLILQKKLNLPTLLTVTYAQLPVLPLRPLVLEGGGTPKEMTWTLCRLTASKTLWSKEEEKSQSGNVQESLVVEVSAMLGLEGEEFSGQKRGC